MVGGIEAVAKGGDAGARPTAPSTMAAVKPFAHKKGQTRPTRHGEQPKK